MSTKKIQQFELRFWEPGIIVNISTERRSKNKVLSVAILKAVSSFDVGLMSFSGRIGA